MPNTQNQTQEEFLKDLEPKDTADIFGETIPQPEGQKPEGEEGTPTGDTQEDDKPNRRERRLQSKLDAERDSSRFLAGKLEALTEAQRLRAETEPSEYVKKIEKIYGTGSPEAIEATELLKGALRDVEQRATERAVELIREEKQKERDAIKAEESTLEGMVEELEDEHGITMDAQTQKGFFQLLEKLSPKDKDGNIIAYADHNAVYEEMQNRKAQAQSNAQPNRAKGLASRSMARTGSSPNTSVEAESNERWLRDNGII